jgi:tRNA threonylcarbamoyladenosine biosynthesis protein TsaB
MKILALDASTEQCTVALWQDGRVNCKERCLSQQHSEQLLPMVQELLDRTKLDRESLEGIAFGSGPGSFTGLRVACGVAQGLALGLNLPVVGVCTLLAMAEAAQAKQVIACLDARLGEVYHAQYKKQGGIWETIHPPTLYRLSECPMPEGRNWVGAGNGFCLEGGLLVHHYDGYLERIMPDVYPHARYIADLAAAAFAKKEGVAAALALPLYVRNKVALKEHERK